MRQNNNKSQHNELPCYFVSIGEGVRGGGGCITLPFVLCQYWRGCKGGGCVTLPLVLVRAAHTMTFYCKARVSICTGHYEGGGGCTRPYFVCQMGS